MPVIVEQESRKQLVRTLKPLPTEIYERASLARG